MNTVDEYGFYESDWKLFRKKLPKWQENYLEMLTKEYMGLLSDKNKIASEKFWELDKRIKNDKKKTAVLARDVCRTNLYWMIIELLNEGAISMSDLDDFSDLFKDRLNDLLSPSKWRSKYKY